MRLMSVIYPSRLRFWLALLLCLTVFSGLTASTAVSAQEETPEPDPTPDVPPQNLIVFGEIVTGQINNNQPNVVYVFDALRCDFLSVRLRALNGNLDPVLTVLDDTGRTVFTRDDTNGSSDVSFEPLSIPRSGRYSIVVARFGYGLGTTSGQYELFIERIGNGSASGCAMRYGDTVTNSIGDDMSELWYRFEANQGDIVQVQMRAIGGTLDPVLTIVDSGGFVMQRIDDIGGDINPQIDSLLIPADGVYYVVAGRYGVGSGSFVLTLSEAANSGMGNSPLAAIPLSYGGAIEGRLTENLTAQYYRFQAQQNDVITVTMERVSDNIDTLIVIADSALNELIEDDDGGEGQNSRLQDFRIPAGGTYYIIATRYERDFGSTTGRYTLRLDAAGSAFEDVPADVLRISYNTTLTGSIDDVTPDVLYAFYGAAGDVVSLTLIRTDGNLDPLLELLDANQARLRLDDDSAEAQNARIDDYVLPASGVYYVRAARFDGSETSGSYALTLFAQIADQDTAAP